MNIHVGRNRYARPVAAKSGVTAVLLQQFNFDIFRLKPGPDVATDILYFLSAVSDEFIIAF